MHPLTGSNEFVELNGTVRTRKVRDGRALLEEIEADGTNGHWQGLTLFFYNPNARQWSQSFFNSATVAPSPPLIGSFHNGRGELYSHDTLDGKAILVRGVWSDVAQDAHKYEESFSLDGGSTWELVFSASLTRLAKDAAVPDAGHANAPHEGSHEFDFGSWQAHSSRLQKPLTGSTTWRISTARQTQARYGWARESRRIQGDRSERHHRAHGFAAVQPGDQAVVDPQQTRRSPSRRSRRTAVRPGR